MYVWCMQVYMCNSVDGDTCIKDNGTVMKCNNGHGSPRKARLCYWLPAAMTMTGGDKTRLCDITDTSRSAQLQG